MKVLDKLSEEVNNEIIKILENKEYKTQTNYQLEKRIKKILNNELTNLISSGTIDGSAHYSASNEYVATLPDGTKESIIYQPSNWDLIREEERESNGI